VIRSINGEKTEQQPKMTLKIFMTKNDTVTSGTHLTYF